MDHISRVMSLVAVSLLVVSVVALVGLGSDTGGSSADDTTDSEMEYQYWGDKSGNGKENATVTGGTKNISSANLKWHAEKVLVLKVKYMSKSALPEPVAYAMSVKTEDGTDYTDIELENDKNEVYGLSITNEGVISGTARIKNVDETFKITASDSSLLSSVSSLKVVITATFIVNSKSTDVVTDYTINVYHPPKIILNQPSNGEGTIGYRVGSVENGSVSVGDSVELFHNENTGYVFYQWVSSDVEIVDDKFTMPDEDVTVTAKFTKIDYTLSCAKAEVQYGGNLVLDIAVSFNDPSKVLTDPHFFIIAKYDESKVINVYSQVSLSTSPGTSRIALSLLGLQDVYVEIVDGISSGLPEYYGYCHYAVSG